MYARVALTDAHDSGHQPMEQVPHCQNKQINIIFKCYVIFSLKGTNSFSIRMMSSTSRLVFQIYCRN